MLCGVKENSKNFLLNIIYLYATKKLIVFMGRECRPWAVGVLLKEARVSRRAILPLTGQHLFIFEEGIFWPIQNNPLRIWRCL